jgi:hypothetical protein
MSLLVLHLYVRKREPLNCGTTVRITISNCMHTLEFNFHTITNEVAIDALVYALSIELLTTNGIDCAQPQANRLEFDTAAQCTFAQLALSDNSTYTITRL